MERKASRCPRIGEARLRGMACSREELKADSPAVSALAAGDLATVFKTKLINSLCHKLQVQFPEEL